jgi:hypothetical protein
MKEFLKIFSSLPFSFPRIVLVTLAILFLPWTSRSQWTVLWQSAQAKQYTSCEETLVGQMDDDSHLEIVWCLSDKKSLYQIFVVDGVTGEVKWHSDVCYKIFPNTMKLADMDGDHREDLVYAAQLSAKSPITFYVVKFQGGTFAQLENTPPSQAPVQSTGSTETRPASDSLAGKSPSVPAADSVQLIPDNLSAPIEYSVSQQSKVRVDIFNGTGDLVRTLVNGDSQPGDFTTSWDGRNDNGNKLATGTYFYKVTVGKIAQERKVIIFR